MHESTASVHPQGNCTEEVAEISVIHISSEPNTAWSHCRDWSLGRATAAEKSGVVEDLLSGGSVASLG